MNKLINTFIKKDISDINQTVLSVLPLRQVILYPGTEMTLDIGRKSSKEAVQKANKGGFILLFTQKKVEIEKPSKEDLYSIGTIARIKDIILQTTNNGMRIVVDIYSRVILEKIIIDEPFIQASWKYLETDYTNIDHKSAEAYFRNLSRYIDDFNQLSGKLNQEQLNNLNSIAEFENKLDYLANIFFIEAETRYQFLSEKKLENRFNIIINYIGKEIEIINLEAEINIKLKHAMDKSQREYYLREKIKVIHDELGESADKENDIIEFKNKIEQLNVNEEIKNRLRREVDKLYRTNTVSPDYGNLVNYIDFAINLPWNRNKKDNYDIKNAEKILNADHYGINKVKDRILEFLAVKSLNSEHKGSIICLVGPPGVGKTSLVKSIARATNRDYIRLSLGGIEDESEIRGHRRTYIGSMPGRIISSLNSIGTSNPVFLLDEIDKIKQSFRGDPASALLEALDPAQNNTFHDHYLDLPFDLSKVLFITTANSMDTIPGPLRDRMEVINVPSYTEIEKLEIAKKYLIPRQIKEHGLSKKMISFTDSAIMILIREYTAESGVRDLERKIASVCRKIACEIVKGKVSKTSINKKNIYKILGKKIIHHLITNEEDTIGVAVGMAWTPFGGEILHIESQIFPGKGQLKITGQLGDVMKESVQIAFSVVRSLSNKYHLKSNTFDENDFHIHVPEGAVPKDGPSAGAAISVAILSTLINNKIRRDVAITGEINLRGRIMAVGGVREKVLAAHRAGCTEVIIPIDNKPDIEDIPFMVKEGLKIHCVERVEQILEKVLINGATYDY